MMSSSSSLCAAECAPAVVVSGDKKAAAEVQWLLLDSGVSPKVADGCPNARANLRADGDALEVELFDGFGRTQTRRVSSAKTAAALIESWITVDTPSGNLTAISAPPATQETEPAPPSAAAAPPTQDQPTPASNTKPTPSVPARAAFLLEAATGTDASVWGAATLAGCVRLGPVCGGGLVRGAEDTRISGDAPEHDSERVAADVLLTIAVPLEASGVTLSPGLGAGLNWVHIRSRLESKVEPGAVVDDDSASPALELFLNASWPIAQGLAFDVRATAQAAPLAHTGTFFDEGVIVSGAPWGRLLAGFGLSYGVP